MERTLMPACIALLAAALAAGCSGTNTMPAPVHTTTPALSTGTVTFTVTAPISTSASGARRPSFDAPSGTQSVSISLTSVDGTAQTSQATVANISSTASGCTPSSTQISCTVSVTAPAGSDVFSVSTYSQPNAQGTLLGKGNVTAQTTQGQTTTAPVTLSGTVASITLSLGTPPITGVAAAIPLVVVAKDSSGAAILGTYTNAIALSDSDASGATKLSSASIADSTAASAVTIAYTGASLASAAQISASSANVPSSAITNASFAPNDDYTVQNGATFTYSMSASGVYTAVGSSPSPEPTESATVTATFKTGATFHNQTNLIDVHDVVSGTGGALEFLYGLLEAGDSYYAWTPTATGATLYEVGWSGDTTDSYNNPVTNEMVYAAPGMEIAQVPFAKGASWSARVTSTSTYAANNYDGSGNVLDVYKDTYVFNADGSSKDSYSDTPVSGTASTGVFQVNSDSSMNSTSTDWSGDTDVETWSTPEPAPTGTPGMVIEYADTYTPAGAPSPAPTPAITYYPDWWPNNGAPQTPLMTDTIADNGSAAIPQSCALPSSVGTSGEDLHETVTYASPDGYIENFSTDEYYVPGLGLACGISNDSSSEYDTQMGTLRSQSQWTATEALTSSTLASALRRTDSMSAAAAFATAGLQSALQQMREMRLARARTAFVRHVVHLHRR